MLLLGLDGLVVSSKVLFLLFDHQRQKFRVGSLTNLVHGSLELAVEPDVWLGSELQAVWTRGVSRVFSQDLQGPLALGSTGFQVGQAIPRGFYARILFSSLLFGGWLRNLFWTLSVTRSFR